MTTPKHTPTPWLVHYAPDSYPCVTGMTDSGMVTICDSVNTAAIAKATGKEVT